MNDRIRRPAVPLLPVDTEPPGGHLPEPERLAMLVDALAGVPLGAYDERIVAWLARADTPTVRAVVSLIDRACVVAPVGLELTCGACGAGLVVDGPVESWTVAADAAQRAAALRDTDRGAS